MKIANSPYGKFRYFNIDVVGGKIASGIFWDEWNRMYLDKLTPGDTFVDVGASIGFYTVYAASRGVMVEAFEPAPEVFDLLVKNVVDNPGAGNVSCHNVPLYDKETELGLEQNLNFYLKFPDGTIDFERSENSAVFTLIPKDKGGVELPDAYKMQTRTLDSYGFEKVNLIKVDTQGADLRVLVGAEDTIRRCRPEIVFEVERPLIGYHDDSWEGFQEFFREMGYYEPQYIGGVDWHTSYGGNA